MKHLSNALIPALIVLLLLLCGTAFSASAADAKVSCDTIYYIGQDLKLDISLPANASNVDLMIHNVTGGNSQNYFVHGIKGGKLTIKPSDWEEEGTLDPYTPVHGHKYEVKVVGNVNGDTFDAHARFLAVDSMSSDPMWATGYYNAWPINKSYCLSVYARNAVKVSVYDLESEEFTCDGYNEFSDGNTSSFRPEYDEPGVHTYVPVAYYGDPNQFDITDTTVLRFGSPITVAFTADGSVEGPAIALAQSTVNAGDMLDISITPESSSLAPETYRVHLYSDTADGETYFTFPADGYNTVSVTLPTVICEPGNYYKVEAESVIAGRSKDWGEKSFYVAAYAGNTHLSCIPEEVSIFEDTQLSVYIPGAANQIVRYLAINKYDPHHWSDEEWELDSNGVYSEAWCFSDPGDYDIEIMVKNADDEWVTAATTHLLVDSDQALAIPGLSVPAVINANDDIVVTTSIPENTLYSYLNIWDFSVEQDNQICHIEGVPNGTFTVTQADLTMYSVDKGLVSHQLIPGHHYEVTLDVETEGFIRSWKYADFIVPDQPKTDIVLTVPDPSPTLVNEHFFMNVSAPGATRVEIVDSVANENSEISDYGEDNGLFIFRAELADAGDHLMYPIAYYRRVDKNGDEYEEAGFGAPVKVTLAATDRAGVPTLALSTASVTRGDNFELTVTPASGSQAGSYVIRMFDRQNCVYYDRFYRETADPFTDTIPSLPLPEGKKYRIEVQALGKGLATDTAEIFIDVVGKVGRCQVTLLPDEVTKDEEVRVFFVNTIDLVPECSIYLIDKNDAQNAFMVDDTFWHYDVTDSHAFRAPSAGNYTVQYRIKDENDNWVVRASADLTVNSGPPIDTPEVTIADPIIDTGDKITAEITPVGSADSIALKITTVTDQEKTSTVLYSTSLDFKQQTFTIDPAVIGLTGGRYRIWVRAVTDDRESKPFIKHLLVLDGLAQLKLPSNMHTVGEQAFENTAAQLVIIPANVEAIGAKALNSCPKLLAVRFLGTNTTIAADAFSDNHLIIICPSGSTAKAYADQHGLCCFDLDPAVDMIGAK